MSLSENLLWYENNGNHSLFPFFFQLIMSFIKVALSDTALKILSLILVSKVRAAIYQQQLQITKHRSATVCEWNALARVKSLIRAE